MLSQQRICILITATLLAVPAWAFTPVATLEGAARVVDGDTIRVGRVPVRLNGIAAPEFSGTRVEIGGIEATEAMRALVDGRHVVCDLDGSRTHGREVGRCAVEGQDIGEAMVRAGLARDCPRFSGGDYAAAEQEARAAGRDLSALYALPGYCQNR
ncbi:MAG: thermonuclease family protein [Pseudomonadota bacterium]